MTDTTTDPQTDDGHTVVIPSDTTPETPATPAATGPKRGKGELEADVKRVCDSFATGGITLDEGELLTPHRIARLINEANPPSTGAVAANLDRWAEIGFAVLNDKPVAFLEYTDAASTEGLTALKAASTERKRTALKAARAAEKAAAPEATPEPVVEAPTGQAPEAPEAPAPTY